MTDLESVLFLPCPQVLLALELNGVTPTVNRAQPEYSLVPLSSQNANSKKYWMLIARYILIDPSFFTIIGTF
jgi:hypothetical protein